LILPSPLQPPTFSSFPQPWQAETLLTNWLPSSTTATPRLFELISIIISSFFPTFSVEEEEEEEEEVLLPLLDAEKSLKSLVPAPPPAVVHGKCVLY
jgi:hypothetical protein